MLLSEKQRIVNLSGELHLLNLQDFQDITGRKYVVEILKATNYNFVKAAKKMQIQRSHLYNLVNKYGIERPPAGPSLGPPAENVQNFSQGELITPTAATNI